MMENTNIIHTITIEDQDKLDMNKTYKYKSYLMTMHRSVYLRDKFKYEYNN